MSKITVVTASIGNPHLVECVDSIRSQTMRDVEHYVVVDGIDRYRANEALYNRVKKHAKLIILPEPTGLDGYFSYRVYGGINFFVNSEFVTYLDEDNFVMESHLESNYELCSEYGLDWSYSLRKIVSDAGATLCEDNCNSLGIWPAFDGNYHQIDMNCYFLKTPIAVQASPIFYRRAFRDKSSMCSDRALCSWLMEHYPRFFTSGLYSLNYRVGGGSSLGSVDGQIAFYKRGNRILEQYYKEFPWRMRCPLYELENHPLLVGYHKPGAYGV